MKADSDRVKVTLSFPLFDNDGNPFTEDDWNWWNREMSRLFSGFTQLGIVDGWWKGHSDQNRWVVIILDSKRGLDRVRTFLRQACARFRQKKMYLDYHSVHYEEVS